MTKRKRIWKRADDDWGNSNHLLKCSQKRNQGVPSVRKLNETETETVCTSVHMDMSMMKVYRIDICISYAICISFYVFKRVIWYGKLEIQLKIDRQSLWQQMPLLLDHSNARHRNVFLVCRDFVSVKKNNFETRRQKKPTKFIWTNDNQIQCTFFFCVVLLPFIFLP